MRDLKTPFLLLFTLLASDLGFASDSNEVSETQIKMEVESAGIKIDYRLEGAYEDNRFAGKETTFDPASGAATGADLPGDDASATSRFTLVSFRPSLFGEIIDGLSFKVRYDLAKQELNYAYLKKDWGKLYLKAGAMKIYQGGYTQKNSAATKAYNSLYKTWKFLPSSSYGDGLEFGFKLSSVGKVSFQIIEDPLDDGQLALFSQWTGDFSGVSPMVQYALFDKGNSNHFNVGLAYELSDFMVVIDYTMTTVQADDEEQVATGLSGEFAYKVKDVAKPYVFVSTLDVTQPGKDLKYNKYDASSGQFKLDDNGTQVVVGVECLAIHPGFIPFVQYEKIAGKFLVSDTAGATEEKEETSSTAYLGVLGKF